VVLSPAGRRAAWNGGSRLSWLEAFLLGVVQGLTEFVPVSSDGHLALVPVLFGSVSPSLTFNVALHGGTLLAAFVYYAKDVGAALGGIGRFLAGLARGRGLAVAREDEPARLGLLVLAATVPTGVIAVATKDYIERWERIPAMAAICLVVTGLGLLLADRCERRRAGEGIADARSTSWTRALFIGTTQAAGLLPGISRSGSCIVSGLLLGLERQFAVRFGFLMMLPAVLGATVFELKDLLTPDAEHLDLGPTLLGAVAAAVTGYAAIAFTLRAVRARRLWVFGLYCVALGAVGVALLWQMGRLGEGIGG
jgi:undecaprenyl-diphosphatase